MRNAHTPGIGGTKTYKQKVIKSAEIRLCALSLPCGRVWRKPMNLKISYDRKELERLITLDILRLGFSVAKIELKDGKYSVEVEALNRELKDCKLPL